MLGLLKINTSTPPGIVNMEEINNNLVFHKDDFEIGYNLNFCRFARLTYKKEDYIPWSNCLVLLKKLYPALVAEYVETEWLPHGESGDLTAAVRVRLRGLETNRVTQNHYYPIIGDDKLRSAQINPTSRDISDAIMRAFVKCIAIETGIGYRLFTREEIDIKQNDKAHPKYKGLVALAELEQECLICVGSLPSNWVAPHFGMQVPHLRELYKELSSYIKNPSSEQADKKTEDVQEEAPTYYEYKGFKMPTNWKDDKDRIAWVKTFAHLTESEAKSTIEDHVWDKSLGDFNTSFFHYVIDCWLPDDVDF